VNEGIEQTTGWGGAAVLRSCWTVYAVCWLGEDTLRLLTAR